MSRSPTSCDEFLTGEVGLLLEHIRFSMNDKPAIASHSIRMRMLNSIDAAAYREVRVKALRTHPPAFGSLPEDEPDLAKTAERLVPCDDRCFFGAFFDEQLLGIIRLSSYDAPNEKHRMYLGGLYVLPAFRRLGCGRALVQQALHRATNTPGVRRINLTVVTQQTAAIDLYRSIGFQIYGTEPETFSRDGYFYDEHLMTLDLTANNMFR
jgi:ribosomal protein S18 acetylase RimI-like enzyme